MSARLVASRLVATVLLCVGLPVAYAAAPVPEVSFGRWLVAAESGDPGAQFEVAKRYDEGDGVDENLAQAALWYRKAAEQGHSVAQLRLAWMYAEGDGVAEDKAQAFGWFQRAAAGGNALAQYRVAWAYVNGDPVAKDPEQAKYWMKRAAEQGYADAQNALGYLYHHAEASGDYLEAARWYMAAIGQEHIFAVGNLADLMRERPAAALRVDAQVHAAPTLSSAVVGALPAGTTVVRLESAADWIAIVDKQRRVVGWVESAEF